VKETQMATVTRRSVLRSSLALGAAGALARPYIANAAATTATVWWTQGYAQEEDIAFKKIVAEYEKATGNTIDYSIVPNAPLRQKIVSAVTSGVVPDVFPNQPAEIIALFAWNDKLVDLTDVVETQREEYTETALLTAYCWNSVEKKRSFYGAPYTQGVLPNHVWRPLVEKAGFKLVGSSEIDAKIEATLAELDPVKTRALANEVDKAIWAEGFSLPLTQTSGNVAVRSNLANFGAAGLSDVNYTAIGFMKA